MSDVNFYQYKSGKKSELCKTCLTAHINNWEPDTFLWLLEKFDVPYIEEEWNVLRDRAYAKDPLKFGPMSVFGKYLSKMKLNQWKGYSWADTERLKKESEERAKLYGGPQANQATVEFENIQKLYEEGQIGEAQYQTYLATQAPEKEFEFDPNTKQVVEKGAAASAPQDGAYPANPHPFEVVDIPDFGADLTPEDKIEMAIKWGQLYSAADWVYLEKKYQDFMSSFDIQGAAREDSLIQICKLSLKLNQALDSGDMDTYSKIVRSYDTLMKSAKFTEAQKKEDKEAEFNSYGQIVSFAEKFNDEDYIRPIDLSVDRDIVDKDIHNIKNFTKQLIEDDPAVFKLIEQYIKKREILADQEAAEAELEDAEHYELTDEDLTAYNNSIIEQMKEDNKEEDDEE